MPRGDHVKKGMRIGGRQRGTPNKATQERLLAERIAKQAQDEVNKAQIAKIRLGKDILHDYMNAFHAVAAIYQNRVVAALQKRQEPSKTDLQAFERWGSLAASTARNLAEFQSPKFKAVAVSIPPPALPPPEAKPQDDTKVIDDPVALSKWYGTMMTQVK